MPFSEKLKKLLLGAILAAIISCQNKPIYTAETKAIEPQVSRYVASVDEENQSEKKHRQTFVELMSESDEKTRHERIKDFMDRQRGFFYIAHELMITFDQRLSELALKKAQGEKIKAEDFHYFNEMRFKNLIAWEWIERNQQEMLDLFKFTLEAANTSKSPFQKKALDILTFSNAWFEDGWEKGDRSAVILIAQQFEEITEEMFPKKLPQWVPTFKQYTNLSKAELQKAYQQSAERAKTRQREPIDGFLQRKWEIHLENRRQDFSDLFSQLYDIEVPEEDAPKKDDRKPGAAMDVLEPDPGPNGHVTGNRFPMGKWAITFDDGPNPVHTQGMFENLKSTGSHGTFFWLTQNMLKYPELVKKAGDLGFSRASHSYSHANLPKLKPAELNHEVNEALDGFANVVGQPATFFRCPYGACGGNGSKIRELIAARKALEIFWNVDTLDWQDKNPQSVFERARKQVDLLGRGIILFHDIHPQSVIASKQLMEYIKANPKLTLAPLTALIGESRGKEYTSP